MRFWLAVLFSIVPVWASGELSNRRAPGFSLPGSDSQQHDPQDHRGKVLLIEMMQTGCEHCRRFSAVLEEAMGKFGDRLAVLSVVTMPDTAEKVTQFIQANKIRAPILFDCGQMMASYLKITPANPTVHFPHVFIVDGEGMIRNDFAYGPGTEAIFEGKALFAEIEKLLVK